MVIFRSPRDLPPKLAYDYCQTLTPGCNLEEQWYAFLCRPDNWPIVHIWGAEKYPFKKDKRTYKWCVDFDRNGDVYYRGWEPKDLIS